MLRSFLGGTFFGAAWGQPPPGVVALHGWRRDHQDFTASLGPSSPEGQLDCIALDLPGFGATPAPPEVCGTADYASAVADLVAGPQGPSGPAVVVGHSFGGRVAVQLAFSRPELVGALVLTGVPLLPRAGKGRSSPPVYRLVRGLNKMRIVSDERLERARKRYGSEDYRAAEGTMRGVLVKTLAETYGPALQAICCPVELVWGEGDAEVPLEVAQRAQRMLANGALTVCRGAGHMLPLEAPSELRAAVERALQLVKS